MVMCSLVSHFRRDFFYSSRAQNHSPEKHYHRHRRCRKTGGQIKRRDKANPSRALVELITLSLTNLEAIVAPVLASPVLTNGQFRFNVSGAMGHNYAVQTSTNLTTTNWISLFTNAAPFTFIDTNASNFIQRFYRAVY